MSSIITQYNSRDGLDHALIEQCKIVRVDTATKTCWVVAMVSQRSTPREVAYATPMLHGVYGSGAEFAPEPETLCYVCTPPDGTGAFVFAYVMGSAAKEEDLPYSTDVGLSYAG